jgi:hypothetical protein
VEHTSKNKGIRKISYLKMLLIGFIGSTLFRSCYNSLVLVEQQHRGVNHKLIYEALNDTYDMRGEVPTDLEGVAALEHSLGSQKYEVGSIVHEERDDHNLCYFPDAWTHPEQILLVSSTQETFIVTFGDGSTLTLPGKYIIKSLRESQGISRPEDIIKRNNRSKVIPSLGVTLSFILPLTMLMLIQGTEYVILFKKRIQARNKVD